MICTFLSYREARRIIKGVVTIIIANQTEDEDEESEVSEGR
jgi:hypothetical protein